MIVVRSASLRTLRVSALLVELFHRFDAAFEARWILLLKIGRHHLLVRRFSLRRSLPRRNRHRLRFLWCSMWGHGLGLGQGVRPLVHSDWVVGGVVFWRLLVVDVWWWVVRWRDAFLTTCRHYRRGHMMMHRLLSTIFACHRIRLIVSWWSLGMLWRDIEIFLIYSMLRWLVIDTVMILWAVMIYLWR